MTSFNRRTLLNAGLAVTSAAAFAGAARGAT